MSRHRAQVMSDSSARALRTVYHAVVSLVGLVPTLMLAFAAIPPETPGHAEIMIVVANVLVWTGVASKIINALEDHGIIPAPWKQLTTEPIVVPAKKEVNHGNVQEG